MFNLDTYDFYTWLKYLFNSNQTSKITENMRFFFDFLPHTVQYLLYSFPQLNEIWHRYSR